MKNTFLRLFKNKLEKFKNLDIAQKNRKWNFFLCLQTIKDIMINAFVTFKVPKYLSFTYLICVHKLI